MIPGFAKSRVAHEQRQKKMLLPFVMADRQAERNSGLCVCVCVCVCVCKVYCLQLYFYPYWWDGTENAGRKPLSMEKVNEEGGK